MKKLLIIVLLLPLIVHVPPVSFTQDTSSLSSYYAWNNGYAEYYFEFTLHDTTYKGTFSVNVTHVTIDDDNHPMVQLYVHEIYDEYVNGTYTHTFEHSYVNTTKPAYPHYAIIKINLYGEERVVDVPVLVDLNYLGKRLGRICDETLSNVDVKTNLYANGSIEISMFDETFRINLGLALVEYYRNNEITYRLVQYKINALDVDINYLDDSKYYVYSFVYTMMYEELVYLITGVKPYAWISVGDYDFVYFSSLRINQLGFINNTLIAGERYNWTNENVYLLPLFFYYPGTNLEDMPSISYTYKGYARIGDTRIETINGQGIDEYGSKVLFSYDKNNHEAIVIGIQDDTNSSHPVSLEIRQLGSSDDPKLIFTRREIYGGNVTFFAISQGLRVAVSVDENQLYNATIDGNDTKTFNATGVYVVDISSTDYEDSFMLPTDENHTRMSVYTRIDEVKGYLSVEVNAYGALAIVILNNSTYYIGINVYTALPCPDKVNVTIITRDGQTYSTTRSRGYNLSAFEIIGIIAIATVIVYLFIRRFVKEDYSEAEDINLDELYSEEF